MTNTKNVSVGLRNLGTLNKNVVYISTDKGSISLYFSYETLVAVNGLVSENGWSKTTAKFLNELEPNKKQRVKHEEVLKEANKRLNGILFSTKELTLKNLE